MILGLIPIGVYFIIASICYNFLVKFIPDEVEYNNRSTRLYWNVGILAYIRYWWYYLYNYLLV